MFVEAITKSGNQICCIELVDAEGGNKLTVSYGRTANVYFQGRGTDVTLMRMAQPQKATECYEQFKKEWVADRKVLTYTTYQG